MKPSNEELAGNSDDSSKWRKVEAQKTGTSHRHRDLKPRDRRPSTPFEPLLTWIGMEHEFKLDEPTLSETGSMATITPVASAVPGVFPLSMQAQQSTGALGSAQRKAL
jgi:hypothetical protein